MKNSIVKIFALIVAAAFLFSGCGTDNDEETPLKIALSAAEAQKEICGNGGNLLSDQVNFPAGSAICDWTATAFSIIGVKDNYDAYLSALETYVTEKYAEEGGLDRAKATEWHRIAITVLALGGDPTNFGESPDGGKINLIADGTYNYIRSDLGAQGINAYIYALITLDAGGYEVPEGSRYTRESMIEIILASQEADGGFGLERGASDVDITAMALQALAPYAGESNVEKAIAAAVGYLSENQRGDGSYLNGDEKSSESCSQVIMALCANGIDPRTDERFIKHGTSVYDALLKFRLDDGSFIHSDGNRGNPMSTEQAILALGAVADFDNGGNGIFSFS
ncbi:MAG: hypothetical protein ACI4IW_08630 [Oscillospiraceae bacterium]